MSSNLSVEHAEGIEAEFMYHYVANASEEVKTQLGIATDHIGGGVVISVRNDPSRYWSKALGFGFTEPVTADVIDRVLEFYRSQGNLATTIQLAPSRLPADWDAICARDRLRRSSTWVKLACRTEEFSGTGHTDLRVARIEPADGERWARAVLAGFGMPGELAPMIAAALDRPDFRPFAVWDGDDMVASANLFIHGDVASLNSASTQPTHRNRGAQSALLAARAQEAVAAGCRWLVAETGEPAPVNSSFNNMLAAGLRPLYRRHNWTWSG